MKKTFHRRQVLRGMLGGTAAVVGLPILDVMLNDHGTAFAATGDSLPTRLATWFYPLGFGENDWTPKTVGAGYELPALLEPLKPYQDKLNLFTGAQAHLDGISSEPHYMGPQVAMSGVAGKTTSYAGSMDTLVAGSIGQNTRFPLLVATCVGDPNASWVAWSDSGTQSAEVSPQALYERLFGLEFKDPNAANFTPDRAVVLRKSVLSGITDDRKRLMRTVGASDREKLDSYFTSLRSLERKLEVQMTKPEPLPACVKLDESQFVGKNGSVLTPIDDVMARHELFTQLFVHAIACDQTRIASLTLSSGFSGIRLEGDPLSHHTYTHEEQIDAKSGLQPRCAQFTQRYMKMFHDFIAAFDNYKEGDRSLLDRMVIYAYTDHGKARYHLLTDIPSMTVGTGNGRLKTGMHFSRPNETPARVSYSVMQAMGVPIGEWGKGSNKVTSPIPGLLA